MGERSAEVFHVNEVLDLQWLCCEVTLCLCDSLKLRIHSAAPSAGSQSSVSLLFGKFLCSHLGHSCCWGVVCGWMSPRCSLVTIFTHACLCWSLCSAISYSLTGSSQALTHGPHGGSRYTREGARGGTKDHLPEATLLNPSLLLRILPFESCTSDLYFLHFQLSTWDIMTIRPPAVVCHLRRD